jgi:arylsulfatase A-like enzyme
LLATAALALVVNGCGTSEPALRPNVLVILVDALRGDALGANGYPLNTSPAIDRMVREGAVNFRRAYAHSTWTKPSIASLFTSLHPSRHGIHLVAAPGRGRELLTQALDDSFVTLAEAFQAAGYQTGAVINQVHLRGSGFNQGFDDYISLRGKGAGRLNQRLFGWFDKLDRERPFFAYLHYLDAHWPYDNRPPGDSDLELGAVHLDPEPPNNGKQALTWVRAFDEGSLRPLRARYDREVAFVDIRIESVREELESRGYAEDTIIVITSDHGEGFLEHGKIQHGYAPYAEVAHVPLVMRLPPAMAPNHTEIDAPVGLVDVMPTLLDLAGIDAPEGMQGRSLVPLLRGRSPRVRAIPSNGGGAVAMRGARYSVLRFEDRTEVYDAIADPAERRPLDDCAAACRRLLEQAGLYARLLASMNPASAGVALSPEDLEELRQLGYL